MACLNTGSYAGEIMLGDGVTRGRCLSPVVGLQFRPTSGDRHLPRVTLLSAWSPSGMSQSPRRPE